MMSISPFAPETFETRNAKIPKNGFMTEMLLFLVFLVKNVLLNDLRWISGSMADGGVRTAALV
jgi:hypothetical protein